MALSPDILHKIDDLMRGDLQAFRDQYFGWLLLSTYMVVLGLSLEGPEIWHDFRNLFRKPDLQRKASQWIKFAATLGWLLIILGVAGEAYFEGKVSAGDTQLQAFNTSLLIESQRESVIAETSARNAILSAGEAATSAEKATESAGESEFIARSARREADSFERDIASAKRQATESSLRLAVALRQVAEATTELNELKSPRKLSNPPAIVSDLKKFATTKYTFSSVFEDEESINLLKVIDGILQMAGWKRVPEKITGLVPVLNVLLGKERLKIRPAIADGIQISVESSIGYSTLQTLPAWLVPNQVKAAIALRESIRISLFPPQEPPILVHIGKGESTVVSITVGKKP